MVDNVVNALVEQTSLEDTIRESLITWAQETAKVSIKTLLGEMFTSTNIRAAGTGNVFSSFARWISGMFGGGTSTSAGGGSYSGNPVQGILGFADGGIPPTNRVSLVGEKGPELFMPTKKGKVVPNNALSNLGKPNVTIKQDLNITEAMDPAGFQQELIKNNQVIISMIDEAYYKRGNSGGPSGY